MTAAGALRATRRELGGLSCVVVDPGDEVRRTVVLLHGFGAPGDDLLPLCRAMAVAGTRWVFPAGPIELPFGWGDARAWWLVDIVRYERAVRDPGAPAAERLVDDEPGGMAEAREALGRFLDALVVAYPDGGPLVLGGFSQGAMMAVDQAVSSERALAGLVLLSGALFSRPRVRAGLAARRGVTVFQSHGTDDPILPYAFAEMLREELIAAGLEVTFVSFPGGHGIPEPVLARLGEVLARLPGPRP